MMKYYTTTTLKALFFLCTFGLLAFSGYSQGIPELMYYRFNTPGPIVQNESPAATLAGTAAPTILGTTITVGGVGLTGTALNGTGGTTSDYIPTGWNTSLVSTDWTVSFWMNNFPNGTVLWYLFGDAGNLFRCFVNGAPGSGNIRLTGTGLPTVDVTAVTGGVNVLHFVRTVSPNEIKAYKNGVLFSTTAITGTPTVGTGLRIGSYTSGSAISGQLDEFRLYNRALNATEIGLTWNKTLGSKGGNDASISQMTSAPKFCGTSQNVSVKLANMGKNIIANVNVHWELDGTPQPSFTITNPLDTSGHPTNISDTILNLGAISFAPNQTRNIVIWTALPNGVADTLTSNDTLRIVLRPGLNGTYTIGSTSPDFTTFKGATNLLDSFGKCGPLTFDVTSGETFVSPPIFITNYDSITFRKFGTAANPLVVGTNGLGTTDAVFKIAGSKTIQFDGIDVADNISNTTTVLQMEYGYAVMNFGATNGSSNNIIKNCKVTLNRTNTATIGILQSASTTGAAVAATALTGGNHNNRYENVKIENTYKGIGLIGTAGFPDSNTVITSANGDTTIVGGNTANDIGNGTPLIYGISAADQKNVEISKCLVRNITNTGTTTITQGIFIDNGSTTVDYGTARVWNNTVHSVLRNTTSTSTTGVVHGIRIDVSATASARVWNNVVYNINNINPAAVTAVQMVRGISFGATTGTGTAEFYNNSVSISPATLSNSSSAFWKDKAGIVTVRNNIFSNTCAAQTGVAKHYASFMNVAPIIASNNVYYAPNANGFVGFATSDRATLAQFAAAISTAAPTDGNDPGSANANPNFSSATSLDFAAATPAVSSGTPITTPFAITTDILGNLRSTTAPSVGAYETTQPLFDSAAPVITNVIAMNSATPVVYATITDNSGTAVSPSVQLWYRVGTSGSFSGLIPDSIPVGSMNGTYKWGASFAALPAGNYQFYIAARDAAGAGFNISVNPIQAATFTSFGISDPVNYATNPDPAVNTRTFIKLTTLTAGTYTVGPSGTYPKLTDVANALNSTELTGNVVFELQAGYDGTTGETFPIVFNQFGTSGGNWRVIIRPAAAATGLHVRGSNATTLIDLNGAKRITFDGRPGGVGTSKELSFTNTSNAGPVVRFINDAQNDTLRYINIADSTTAVASGNIHFSTTTGTLASSGNSNNLIDNCSINGLANTANCIYSSGSAAPADNKNNTITNCNIFDFFVNVAGAVNGVLLEGGNASWNIGTTGNGNNFYQTATRNSTSIPALTVAVGFRAIQINGAAINGCSIVGNRIGGNIPGIPASTFIIGDNVGATAYLSCYMRAIDLAAAGTTTVTSIQGNTISDITLYTAISAGFAGIHCLGGWVNTGNLAANTVGAPTGIGSINLFYKNTTNGINLYGIRYSGPTTGLIQNNFIGSITVENAGAGTMQLLCLYLSGTYSSAVTVSNNLIGSLTTANSINNTSSSAQAVNIMGIVTSAASGATINITGNTVMNLSAFYTINLTTNGLKGIYITGASSVGTNVSGNIVRKLYSESTNPGTDQTSAIVGISCAASGAGTQTISGNTVSALVSGAGPSAINVVGIYYGSTNTAALNRIERNLIHSLSASPSNGSALVSGITQGAGTAKLLIANNMVRLGLDSTGANATGPHFITGIYKASGSANNTIFNTVHIGGTNVSSGVSNTYAYRSIGAGVDSLLNNMFINTRANATSGGIHYAIGLGSTTTLTINRNLYNAGAAALGQFNGIDQLNLTDWRTATAQDLQSVNTTVNFVSNTDLHLTGASLGNTAFVGTPISGTTIDFDGQTRHASFPYMGADESLTFPLPVVLLNFTARISNEHNVSLNWATASEKNSSHFEVERSADGKQFESLAKVDAAGSSNMVRNYAYADETAPLQQHNLLYYRLQMVDLDGTTEYSKVVSVSVGDEIAVTGLQVYPNPFTKEVSLVFESTSDANMQVEIKDITGKLLGTFNLNAKAGKNTIPVENISNLPSGFYFMTVNLDNTTQTIKLIKD
ncbi:MAG: LamG-like jellyroll fold domain-containing protein [Bacteroidota bacterium]